MANVINYLKSIELNKEKLSNQDNKSEFYSDKQLQLEAIVDGDRAILGLLCTNQKNEQIHSDLKNILDTINQPEYEKESLEEMMTTLITKWNNGAIAYFGGEYAIIKFQGEELQLYQLENNKLNKIKEYNKEINLDDKLAFCIAKQSQPDCKISIIPEIDKCDLSSTTYIPEEFIKNDALDNFKDSKTIEERDYIESGIITQAKGNSYRLRINETEYAKKCKLVMGNLGVAFKAERIYVDNNDKKIEYVPNLGPRHVFVKYYSQVTENKRPVMQRIKRETDILTTCTQLGCEHVVKILNKGLIGTFPFIEMELGFSLQELIEERIAAEMSSTRRVIPRTLTKYDIIDITKDICTGLEEIGAIRSGTQKNEDKERFILHRDMKPGNIILFENYQQGKRYVAKIADLNFAVFTRGDDVPRTLSNTIAVREMIGKREQGNPNYPFEFFIDKFVKEDIKLEDKAKETKFKNIFAHIEQECAVKDTKTRIKDKRNSDIYGVGICLYQLLISNLTDQNLNYLRDGFNRLDQDFIDQLSLNNKIKISEITSEEREIFEELIKKTIQPVPSKRGFKNASEFKEELDRQWKQKEENERDLDEIINYSSKVLSTLTNADINNIRTEINQGGITAGVIKDLLMVSRLYEKINKKNNSRWNEDKRKNAMDAISKGNEALTQVFQEIKTDYDNLAKTVPQINAMDQLSEMRQQLRKEAENLQQILDKLIRKE